MRIGAIHTQGPVFSASGRGAAVEYGKQITDDRGQRRGGAGRSSAGQRRGRASASVRSTRRDRRSRRAGAVEAGGDGRWKVPFWRSGRSELGVAAERPPRQRVRRSTPGTATTTIAFFQPV